MCTVEQRKSKASMMLAVADGGWGPLDDVSEEEDSSRNNNNKKGSLSEGVGNVFKVFNRSNSKSPTPEAATPNSSSRESTARSNKTALTAPVTASTNTTGLTNVSQQLSMKTGMSNPSLSIPNTPSGHSGSNFSNTSAATGNATGNTFNHFWNHHASPATMSYTPDGMATATTSSTGPLSTTASMQLRSATGGSSTPPRQQSAPSCTNVFSTTTTSPISTPLSASAKAAADTVISMIAKAEIFLVTNVGTSTTLMSSVFSGGLCSPSDSPEKKNSTTPPSNNNSDGIPFSNGTIVMEGIPEEEHNMTIDRTQQQGDDIDHGTNTASPPTTNDVCGQEMSCFESEEFEKFGFNPFQQQDCNTGCNDEVNADDRNNNNNGINNPKSISLSPSIKANDSQKRSPPRTPNKGYEIRLKSTFSSIRAKKDNMLDKAIKLKQHQEQQQSQQVEKSVGEFTSSSPLHQSTAAEQPAERKKKSNEEELDNEEYPHGSISCRAPPSGLPIREITIPKEIERSVSELTMRSHGAFELHRYTSDSRRMAYYAVGRAAAAKIKNNRDEDNKNKSSLSGGCNRRCYFSGCIIAYGVPVYAGIVQQGPRTLVVFCLPSALDLPPLTTSASSSSSINNNNKAERERYLESLPHPDAKLLSEMSKRYREPFDTLPVQVRSPDCWRLFVKYCFFSGLPIGDGELHYCVKDNVATFSSSMESSQQQQQEEIALSHEVMEGE